MDHDNNRGLLHHGRVSDVRYYIHRPIEGRPVTCTVKRYRADVVEDAVANHLLNVVQREGYLDGIGKTLKDLYDSGHEAAIAQKRELERKVTQSDLEIKRLVKLQIKTDDDDLGEIYSEQLKELKNQRQADALQLDELKRNLEDVLSADAIRRNIEANLKLFQKAWAKSTPSLQKKLLRSVIHRLALRPDGIDIYYHSDRAQEVTVHSSQAPGSTGEQPVDLVVPANVINFPEKRRRNPSYLPPASVDHNAKVFGWYIVGIGCGGRI